MRISRYLETLLSHYRKIQSEGGDAGDGGDFDDGAGDGDGDGGGGWKVRTAA